jgi:APA family basic amino acid/polyamine antiporter
VDRRRLGRPQRGVFLQRTRRDVSALERQYNFLGRAFHPAFGFVAGWVSATVGFAAPVALAAMAFGEYGRSILPGARRSHSPSASSQLVSLVQLTGVRQSSTFQLIATILKVMLIVAFLVAGFLIATPQPVSFAPSASNSPLSARRSRSASCS